MNAENTDGIIRLHECFLSEPEKRKDYNAFIDQTLTAALVDEKPTNDNEISAWDARMKEISLNRNKGNEGLGGANPTANMNDKEKLSPWDARLKEINNKLKNR